MGTRLTVTALARRAGVSSKAIRYWESLGLLPRASRTHTDYRIFPPEAEQYLRFIRKSKDIGLSLGEMRQVLRLARSGRCPCDHVVEATRRRMAEIESQIRSLSQSLRQLKRVTREWERNAKCESEECGEICSLIDHLPEFQSASGGNGNGQVVEVRSRSASLGGSDGSARPRANGGHLLSQVPALPVPLKRKPRH